MHVELVTDTRNTTGESPVWSSTEQALYWVDIPECRLYRWSLSEQLTQSWHAEEMIACIAPLASGGFLAGMETGIFELHMGQHEMLHTRPVVRIEHAMQGMRCNDGRTDRQGRFWVGTMHMDMSIGHPVGALYQHDKALSGPFLSDLIVPNGLGFSPDGRRMYLSDSHPSVQAIWTFDYDTDEGRPYNRRLFVDMKNYPGRPDGAAVDAEGCYWICANDAGFIHRFTPDGILDRSISLPVKKPTMCAFGGSNLDTLFVTSIRPQNIDISDQPLAGSVFAVRPGVCGLEEAFFQG